jgi:hypothetical protein
MRSTYQLFTLFICTLGLFFFTSAAVAPAKVVEENPPVERNVLSKKEMKKQLRQQARVARLEARMQRASSDKRKLRLQKRIDDVQQGKDAEVTILSVLALIFAFVFAPVGLILAIISRKNGGGILADIAFWVSIVVIIVYIIGVILWVMGR